MQYVNQFQIALTSFGDSMDWVLTTCLFSARIINKRGAYGTPNKITKERIMNSQPTTQPEVINLIPTPDGMLHNLDHRNALGYPWQNLQERIPGDDRPFKRGHAVAAYESAFRRLREQYGEITITERDGILEQLDGQAITIDRQFLVAIICGMWPGSVDRYVYQGKHLPTPRSSKASPVLVDDGSWAMKLEPAHDANGYCRICHSYCYSDCEANGLRYSGQ